ncbi:MAG: YihY/virulence factor BrkB family protein [Halothiobacillaceae bacterium]|nr:MAG: YihY/virulence factor BrkB family protein [Halothiobacillaceae bacterium]
MRPLSQRRVPHAMRPILEGTGTVIRHLWHELDRGQLNLHAMSLSFTTLLSLAPLLAVSFSVLKAFGVQDVLQPFLLNMLGPLGAQGEEIAGRIVSFVENIQVGVLGAVGVALLFYTVIALMQKVERAFNDVWRVSEDRPLAQRFTHYLSVVIVGPVLLFAMISALTQLSGSAATLDVLGGELLARLAHLFDDITPYLMLAGTFAFIYVYVPNTRVRWVPALIGAVLAAAVWMFTGRLFADVVVKTGNYTAIYSAFAGLILFMLWLHLAWLILLLGASVSFALQNPYRVGTRKEASRQPTINTVLHMGALIATDFSRAGKGWTAPALAAETGTGLDEVQAILDRLHEANILLHDERKPPTWRPAAALDAIALEHMIDVAEATPIHSAAPKSSTVILQRLQEAHSRTLAGLTLRDLVIDKQEPDKSPSQTRALPE